jgi:hypothetical protein
VSCMEINESELFDEASISRSFVKTWLSNLVMDKRRDRTWERLRSERRRDGMTVQRASSVQLGNLRIEEVNSQGRMNS